MIYSKFCEGRPEKSIAAERNDSLSLIMVDFDPNKAASMDGTLIFDFESIFDGIFKFFNGVKIIRNDKNIVDVQREKENNSVAEAIINTFVSRKANESKGRDESVDDSSPDSWSLFQTVKTFQ